MINWCPPMQNNKPVKAPYVYLCCMENTALVAGLIAYTALSYALCCTCYSTSPLMLYFPYSTRDGSLTSFHS